MNSRIASWFDRWGCRILLWGIFSALVLFGAQVAEACPTCKDGLSQSDPAAAGLVQGYFWSILFMMAMPFLILGSLGGYFYYEVRKARARQGDAGPVVSVAPAVSAGPHSAG